MKWKQGMEKQLLPVMKNCGWLGTAKSKRSCWTQYNPSHGLWGSFTSWPYLKAPSLWGQDLVCCADYSNMTWNILRMCLPMCTGTAVWFALGLCTLCLCTYVLLRTWPLRLFTTLDFKDWSIFQPYCKENVLSPCCFNNFLLFVVI